MGSISKALNDEFIREIVAHDLDTWRQKAVWTIRFLFILLDDAEIDVVEAVFLVVLTVKVRPWESRTV